MLPDYPIPYVTYFQHRRNAKRFDRNRCIESLMVPIEIIGITAILKLRKTGDITLTAE